MSGLSPGMRRWDLRLSATAATGRKKHDEIVVNLNSILVKPELSFSSSDLVTLLVTAQLLLGLTGPLW